MFHLWKPGDEIEVDPTRTEQSEGEVIAPTPSAPLSTIVVAPIQEGTAGESTVFVPQSEGAGQEEL